MNRIFNLVWDETTGAYVAVSELTRRRGKRNSGVRREGAASVVADSGQQAHQPRAGPGSRTILCAALATVFATAEVMAYPHVQHEVPPVEPVELATVAVSTDKSAMNSADDNTELVIRSGQPNVQSTESAGVDDDSRVVVVSDPLLGQSLPD
ncbi:MAG: ESPR domain-containing protein, partial [Pararheinheimera sp.]|nr:ESPR domain-containing protein [Rheinheimera sp.]